MSHRTLGPGTSPDLGGDPSILLVPLGSTEQHGPHLPLDTDTRIAVAWAERLADRNGDFVVAPAIAYGSSGEHQDFPGTLSIGQDALESVLIELIRSASRSFAAVVLVCGHAGNVEPVRRSVGRMSEEGHRLTALFPHWSPDDARLPPLDAHAGRVETSLLMHLAPELVRIERAEPGAIAPIGKLLERLRTGGVASVSANGVLGDPTGANAVEGRLLLDDLVERSLHLIAGELHPLDG